MVAENPFTIFVCDKVMSREGFISDPISVQVVLRHNALGTAEIVVPSDHRQLANLSQPGARLVINYRDEQVFSGWVKGLAGSGVLGSGAVSITADDDLSLLWEMFAYPTPGADIGSQTTVKDVRSGPAETVVKGFVNANRGRFAQPINVAADQGRGSALSLSLRMTPLADSFFPALDTAGIGIDVIASSPTQSPGSLTVECYVPQSFPVALSEAGGTIMEWQWSASTISNTRAITGGPNTGTSREFRLTADATREATYGRTIESFVDAGDKTLLADLLQAGTDAVAAGKATNGLKVTLTESSVFKYGGTGANKGVHVGDMITMTTGSTSITDVLREATLTWSAEGLTVEPSVGDRDNDPDVTLAKLVAQLAQGVRSIRTR